MQCYTISVDGIARVDLVRGAAGVQSTSAAKLSLVTWVSIETKRFVVGTETANSLTRKMVMDIRETHVEMEPARIGIVF